MRRRDILWGWLPALAEVLFFFHPLLYPARCECRLAQEIACDEEAVLRIGASPHGHYLLFTQHDVSSSPTVVWDMQQGITVQSWDDAIRFARFTPDSTQVWTCSVAEEQNPPRNALALRNVADGKVVRTAPEINGTVLDMSPDGTKVITREPKAGAIVWSISSGQQLSRLACDKGSDDMMAIFTPDRSKVIAYPSAQDIDIWNCRTGAKVQTLSAAGLVDYATISPDGRRLAASVEDKAVSWYVQKYNTVIWDMQNGHVIHLLTHTPCLSRVSHVPHHITALVFTHDGTGLLTNEVDATGLPAGPICRWDVATGHLQRKYDVPAKLKLLRAIAMTADRKLLAMGAQPGTDANNIVLWNLAQGRISKELTLPASNWSDSLAFSPDGAILASSLIVFGDRNRDNSPAHIMVWDTATGKVKKDLIMARTAYRIECVAFSPDGKRLAASSLNGKRIIIWNTADWSIMRQFEMPGIILGELAFSPDGRWLSWITWARRTDGHLSYASLTTLKLATGKTREIRTQEDENLMYVSYSPDSRLLAVYQRQQKSEQRSVIIFAVATGEKKTTLKPPAQLKPAGWFLSGFTPDNTTLISTDRRGYLTLWNANTGEVKLTRKRFNSCLILTDGGKAVLSTDNRCWQLWDTQQLLSEENPLPRATFSWFEGDKWLITTPRGYFDCSPELTGALAWKFSGKMYPYQQYAQQYHRPDLVRQALSW